MSSTGYDAEDELRLVQEVPRSPADVRSPFEHDRSRIIHSAAFRRLQGKTQVYGLGASDYYRTRLTHSLEVAQIGKGLALKLGAAPDLVEAVCLAHDIGHPPFGHAGEAALHDVLGAIGGFNGNAQNIRILTDSERKSARYSGLNLTAATLDGLLKYPWPIVPTSNDPLRSKKGHYLQDEDLISAVRGDAQGQTFECEIMNWSDDVAYSSHDLEDGLVIGTISVEELHNEDKREVYRQANQSYRRDYQSKELAEPLSRSECESDIDEVIRECITATAKRGIDRLATIKSYFAEHINQCVIGVTSEDTGRTPHRYSRRIHVPAQIIKRVEVFKSIVMVCVIQTPSVITMQQAGRKIIRELFEALTNTENKELRFLYASDWRARVDGCMRMHESGADPDYMTLKHFARDYIAMMTDHHAEELWRRIYAPGASLFTSRL